MSLSFFSYGLGGLNGGARSDGVGGRGDFAVDVMPRFSVSIATPLAGALLTAPAFTCLALIPIR